MIKLEIDIVIPLVGITFHNFRMRFNYDSTTIKIILTISNNQTKNNPIETPDDCLIAWAEEVLDNETEETIISEKSLCSEPLLPSVQDPDLVRLARPLVESGRLELCSTGVGGTYFVRDENATPIAIFKPMDEEPGAINNPKKIIDMPLLPSGGGAKREVAAYLLGAQLGVPETHLLDAVCTDTKGLSCKKFGSVQKFIKNDGDATMFGSTRFALEDVQRIGILDLRLLNLDRNGENILVQKDGDKLNLVPIDHAYILPDKVDCIWFEWMTWRQAKQPFQQEALNYIENIDVDHDTRVLESIGIEENAIKLMRKSTLLLKMAAKAGLTLYDLAALVCRKKPVEKSEFETLVEKCNNDEEEFVKCVRQLVDTKMSK